MGVSSFSNTCTTDHCSFSKLKNTTILFDWEFSFAEKFTLFASARSDQNMSDLVAFGGIVDLNNFLIILLIFPIK